MRPHRADQRRSRSHSEYATQKRTVPCLAHPTWSLIPAGIYDAKQAADTRMHGSPLFKYSCTHAHWPTICSVHVRVHVCVTCMRASAAWCRYKLKCKAWESHNELFFDLFQTVRLYVHGWMFVLPHAEKRVVAMQSLWCEQKVHRMLTAVRLAWCLVLLLVCAQPADGPFTVQSKNGNAPEVKGLTSVNIKNDVRISW